MRPLTFGITGKEFQTSFNTEKYVALACQQPRGVLLCQLVEQQWVEWCDIVVNAPWKTYWKRSQYWKQKCTTPANQVCVEGSCGNVPLIIFSSAVWGFGFEGWSKLDQRPLYEILQLQGVKNPKAVQHRNHLWDDKLYRGCGVHMPPEYGDLDRWLEPLWQQVCISSK